MDYCYHDVDQDMLIVTADDQINSDQADELAGHFESLINRGLKKVVVDCAQVAYVSTVGIGLLLLLHKRLSERGSDVKLANVRGLVAEILANLRLDKVFHIYPDVDKARQAYAQDL